MSVSAPDSKFRILLVDDDEGMRSMVRLYIDVMVEGVEWSEASDGQHPQASATHPQGRR